MLHALFGRGLRVALAGLVAGISAVSASASVAELADYPDFVFINGQVLTADADHDFTVAQAVAVRDSRIFAVGSNSEIEPLVGPRTRRIDLRGRSLTPGFIYNDGDNSVPAGDILKDGMWGGKTRPDIGGDSLEQVLMTLAHIVEAEGEPGEPLFFQSNKAWSGEIAEAWDIDTLNELAPNVPIVLYLESSEVLLNTAMIELAIEKGFPADHFHLERDAAGDYTGRGGAHVAGFVGREVRPWPDRAWFDEVAVPAARESLRNYARHGVTVATGHMSAPTMTILNRLFHEGGDALPVRVYPGLDFLRQNPQGEMYLKRMGNLVDFALVDERGPMVTIVGASVGPHSGAPNGASGLLTIEPTKNLVPELRETRHGFNRWTSEWITGLGQSDVTPEQLKQTDYHNVLLARRHGWNITGIHNMGSEGIRIAMQTVVAAENQQEMYVKELWRPQGFDHNIDWVPEIFEYYRAHPELKEVARFGVSLRTTMNDRDAEPLGVDNVLETQYGPEGMARMAPLRTLLEKGIPFHIEGTEPEDDQAYPTWYLQKAVTRENDEGRIVAAEEALDRETALLALTRWAARFIGAQEDIGSIEPGKLADLVVFDGNIMEVPIERLSELRPVLTMVGGRVVYERGEQVTKP